MGKDHANSTASEKRNKYPTPIKQAVVKINIVIDCIKLNPKHFMKSINFQHIMRKIERIPDKQKRAITVVYSTDNILDKSSGISEYKTNPSTVSIITQVSR